MSRCDLIVVGAGSAGCLLASRLAGEFGLHITLLESPSAESPAIDRERPSRWLHQLGSTEDWGYRTQANASLAGRKIEWPRGRGLGGSCRINAMIWFPPTPADLSALCEATGGEWKLRELETAYRCVEGVVRPERPRWLSDPSRRFLKAVDGFSSGVTPIVYRRLSRRGVRWLPSELLAAKPQQIQIVRGIADHLIWDKSSAMGVRVGDGRGGFFELHASLGVVLAAGAVATPTILMRSGVGDRAQLAQHGIERRLECSALGHTMRDHLIMPVVFQRQPDHEPFRDRPTARDLVRWQMLGSGPVASNLAECGGLFEDGSIQIHLTPTHYLSFPKQDDVPSLTIGVNVTRPESTGSVRLTSKRYDGAPEIDPGYFKRESDLEGTIAGVRLARQIAERSPLAESIHCETIPGARRQTVDELTRSIGRYAQTLYHPVGTCRLGGTVDAVIGPDFALRGANRLWVVDASVLPQEPVGNPNATVMMIAWWAAEQIANRL